MDVTLTAFTLTAFRSLRWRGNLLATMRHRQRILEPLGYTVRYLWQHKFNGQRVSRICIASKDDREFFVHNQQAEFYRKLHGVQGSIPRIAKIERQIEGVTLIERAKGDLLWHFDSPPVAAVVEDQLLEFAAATTLNGLIHADIRPWNIFLDSKQNLTVIDWSQAHFYGDNIDLQPTHHESAADKSLKINQIDTDAAHRVGRLIRREITIQEMGHGRMNWSPSWCRNVEPEATG